MNWKLVQELTFSQMKARYRRTVAGFLWVVLSPVIMYSVQAFVFKNILKIKLPNYSLFLLGGLLPWIFIVSSLETGIPVLQNSRDLLIAFKVRPFALVLSSLFDNGINFIAAFLLVLLPAVLFSSVSGSGLWFMPFALLELLIGVSGLLWWLTVLNVFYRDVRFVVHFAMSVLFFMTPIFYPKELIPEPHRFWANMNPLYVMIAPVRDCIYSFSGPDFLLSLTKGMAVSLALLGVSAWYWKRKQNEFYFYI